MNRARPRTAHALGPNGKEAAASGFMIISTCGNYWLLQVEDMKIRGKWTPALNLLGGKKGYHESIMEAAMREMHEETGANSNARIREIVDRMLPMPLPDGTPCVYVPESKYFVFVVTAELADMELLRHEYATAFCGKTSADLVKGDYTRAATRLVVARLSKKGGGVPCESLPCKVELKGFLREWACLA